MTDLPPAGIHSTITRCPDNSFVLSATALNKIFVNNKRIIGDVQLKEKDVISFGWPYNKPVQRGEVVDNFKYDLKYKVHICDGKATSKWHSFPINPDYDQEHNYLNRAAIQYIRKFTWINREIASIMYLEQPGPTCVQLLRLMEEHRLKRDFALELDRTKNKYIQFLVLYNHTHDSDVKVASGLIIGVYHENEQESFDVINDFVDHFADYERSLLSKLECPWRIWDVRRNEDQSLDLQEMHTWFCEIYRSY
ncbi:unnamed protein product [Hymenolepis diminuta]|uniref:CBM20 domain-containing protein n=1 Tax=Hymenolepis diminuta TaxID=6216 RepID=A0A0R3SS60_HYMDI|nr:unnamed protein product [Hymenolepis diminuta]